METIVIGALAHVDSGKTTLSEALLFQSGAIKKKGRVDHKDTTLDFHALEQSRGITIFNKDARFVLGEKEFVFIDTPGHADFSKEMERSLEVLDYAIFILSASEGVQMQDRIIYKELKEKHIPILLFFNKMDLCHSGKKELLEMTQKELQGSFVDVEHFEETVSYLNDELFEEYQKNQTLPLETLQDILIQNEVIPCFFGSALKEEGIKELLAFLKRCTKEKKKEEDFHAYVYKISKDEKMERLTHLKLLGGTLHNKMSFPEDEQVHEIRLYSGKDYTTTQSLSSIGIVAVKGLKDYQVGDHIPPKPKQGASDHSYLSYRFCPKVAMDPYLLFKTIRELNDEFPEIHIQFNEKDVLFTLQGEIQKEILIKIIQDRYHIDGYFDHGSIQYKETIKEKMYGVGHFEPLHHYAECIVTVYPFKTDEDMIFQKGKHLEIKEAMLEKAIAMLKEHPPVGYLSGNPLHGLKIVIEEIAHNRHTSSEDVYEALKRAIEHAVYKGEKVLLEPYHHFVIEVPQGETSKVLFELEEKAEVSVHQKEETTIIKGEAPFSFLREYFDGFTRIHKGKGQFSSNFSRFGECLDNQVIDSLSLYNAQEDRRHYNGSIFFQKGAGFHVPFEEVEKYMHLSLEKENNESYLHNKVSIDEDELKRVWNSLYKPKEHHKEKEKKETSEEESTRVIIDQTKKKECYLFDGYNILYSWDCLKDLAREDLSLARNRLIEILCDLQGYLNCLCILVFDAYKVKGNMGQKYKHDNIYVVYTKERETADAYIEKATHEHKEDYRITVVTSDGLEQLVILSHGARRLSSKEMERKYQQLKMGDH